jgi:hypothetical protein
MVLDAVFLIGLVAEILVMNHYQSKATICLERVSVFLGKLARHGTCFADVFVFKSKPAVLIIRVPFTKNNYTI